MGERIPELNLKTSHIKTRELVIDSFDEHMITVLLEFNRDSFTVYGESKCERAWYLQNPKKNSSNGKAHGFFRSALEVRED